MRKVNVGLVAAGVFLAVAAPASAQSRPHVSSSETSRSTAPTCVVNGDAGACGESSFGPGVGSGALPAMIPGLVIVGAAPVMGPIMGGPVMTPVLGGPIMGDESSGRASTDTDVDRSTRNGRSVTR
ncbi:MAG: hypothetical protein QM692_15060 [Thermomicrobiales bacterium]